MSYSKKDQRYIARFIDYIGDSNFMHLDGLAMNNPKTEEALRKYGDFVFTEGYMKGLKIAGIAIGAGVAVGALAYGAYCYFENKYERKRLKKLKEDFEELHERIEDYIDEMDNEENVEES